MIFFDKVREKLPPFKDYLQHCYKSKKTHKFARDRTQYQLHLFVKNELFNPADPINIETDHIMDGMGIITLETLLKEFRDEKKETLKHLSSNDRACSWNNTSESEKKAGIGLFTNNDELESPFGGLSKQIETHAIFGLTNAGGIAL